METPLVHPDADWYGSPDAGRRPVPALSSPALPSPGAHPLHRKHPPLHPVWRWFEERFQRAYALRPVSDDPQCLIAYHRSAYRGAGITLRCGTLLREGDPLVEIHFRREALLPLAGADPARVAIQLLKWADRDLPLLATQLERDPAIRDARALHALTLFHGAVARYGFEVTPIRERHRKWWFTAWQRLLLQRDHHAGGAHARKLCAELDARHIWLSREALIQRCAAHAARDLPAPAPAAGR